MNFRNYMYSLDNTLILESDEIVLDNDGIFEEIKNLLEHMSDDEIDEFGAFLSMEFFDATEDDIEEVYFDIENVIEMIKELGEESYSFILELLLPETVQTDDGYTEIEYDLNDLNTEDSDEEDEEDELEEGVSRVLKTKNINRKKRKFFKKTAATLRREKAARMKKNRLTRASRKAYRRINQAKLKAYMKSRNTLIKKGKHKVKIRKRAGDV